MSHYIRETVVQCGWQWSGWWSLVRAPTNGINHLSQINDLVDGRVTHSEWQPPAQPGDVDYAYDGAGRLMSVFDSAWSEIGTCAAPSVLLAPRAPLPISFEGTFIESWSSPIDEAIGIGDYF